MGNLTYEDYKQRLSVEDVLLDAGYVRNRKDGMRYPSYVRLDDSGRRVRGDKFIVTQGGQCCFRPPVQKSYNIISLIKEHPDMFPEYSVGMNLDLLVNKVCSRLLNTVYETGERTVREPVMEVRPFDLSLYEITPFRADDRDSQKPFYPFFKHRGISRNTQEAFAGSFVLAERTADSGKTYRNLSFPLTIPGGDGTVVGFEERGRMRRDGNPPYKGKAAGSNAATGLWMASPDGTPLDKAERIMLFESAYDAMAYWQMHSVTDKDLRKAVFVSTGGTPTAGQMSGLLKNAPNGTFHLCFDDDAAGRQFVANFEHMAKIEKPYHEDALAFLDTPGLIELDDEKYMALKKLPDAILQQHSKVFRLAEEAVSAYLSPEDRAVLDRDYAVAVETFDRMVDGCLIHIIRETPSQGYKDFNDELLGKTGNGEAPEECRAAGCDLDGDGTVETEESDEQKHKIHR